MPRKWGRSYNFFGLSVGRRRFKQLAILLITALLGLGGGLFLRGKVVSVPDGDSLVVLGPDFSQERIRLYGVDCPEGRQTGGEEAAGFSRSLALFEEVKVTVIARDRYKRSVALVTLPDGRSLNEELIRAGHAWVYDRYCGLPQCLLWRKLEKEAREKRAGLWAKERPTPPWKWRQNKRQGK